MRLKAALGLRGAPPLHLLPDIQAVLDLTALEDVAYADQPLFWWTQGEISAGVAGQLTYIGVRAGTPRVAVDGLILDNPDAAAQIVQVLVSNQQTVLPSDTTIWSANRASTAPNNPASPNSRRIATQNATAFGQAIIQARLLSNTSMVVPMRWRLAVGGELYARSSLAVGIGATLWGREFQD